MTIFLLFPHQLFRDTEPLRKAGAVYLVEEFLFFRQYTFHKQKLVLHRGSMMEYAQSLREQSIEVHYIDARDPCHDVRTLLQHLAGEGITTIHYYDVCDQWLEQRIKKTCLKSGLDLTEHPTPLFLNTRQDLQSYFGGRKRLFQTEFYILQRKRLGILIDRDEKPLGGQWSFDADNRKRYPKGKQPPPVVFPDLRPSHREAIAYVETHFPNNPGFTSANVIYPINHRQCEAWLSDFLETRFAEFGAYEDAIVPEAHFLHHSVLSPLMNIGLLLPMQVVEAALAFAEKNDIPLNALEGFIRQIIGWREFVRGVYVFRGTELRNSNVWSCKHSLPSTLYTGTTGVPPIDQAIRKLLHTGYNHHIERLMVLGNFMLLTEIHPQAVYRWFMEMYIDAYDWVMVPNVYGMSQCAAPGLMTTKPYLSGSNYLLRMGHYAKAPWCALWDALFWHFIQKHQSYFLSNPRLGLMVRTYQQMPEEKKQAMEVMRSDFMRRFTEV